MSRYARDECYRFVKEIKATIEETNPVIDKVFENMVFENAREREDAKECFDAIKGELSSLSDKLGRYSFG